MSAKAKDLAVFAGACAFVGLPAAWGGLWAPWEVRAFRSLGDLALSTLGPVGVARMPGVLSVGLTAWLTYRLGTAWVGRRRALLAVAVLLTCPLVLLQGARLLGDAPRMFVEALVVVVIHMALPRASAAGAFVVPLLGAALAGASASVEAPGLDTAVRHVGLGLFPWICLVPGALAEQMFAGDEPARGGVGPVITAWACGGLVAAALAPSLGVAPLLSAAPALALLVAGWSGPAARAEQAVIVAIFVLVGSDLLSTDAGAVHALLPAADLSGEASGWLGWRTLYSAGALAWAAWAWTEGPVGRSVIPAVALCLIVAPVQTAGLSAHLSRAGAVDRWRALAGPDEPLVAYKLGEHADARTAPARGVERLGELRRLMTDSPGRVFALVRSPDLVPVDTQFRRHTERHLSVVDRTSQRVVLVSNRLGPGEVDHNPLTHAIRLAPPAPVGHPTDATLDGHVTLLGADLSAAEVPRGGAFDVTLHFAVTGATARRWRVFIHMERGGYRLPGERTDHDPVGGLYGTERWSAGEYIADRHTIEVPWLSASPGEYRLYAGLHQGQERAPVLPTGADADEGRVFIGQIRVISW